MRAALPAGSPDTVVLVNVETEIGGGTSVTKLNYVIRNAAGAAEAESGLKTTAGR